MTVPDKWEYPWFAAWDLAFQCVAVRPGRSASSPRSSSGSCCSSSSSTPTARSRPTSGSSPTSTRRSTPGPSGGSTTWTASASGKADRDVPGALLPQAADQLRLVDQQGRPRGEQHLRGRVPRARQHHGRRPQRAAAATASRLEQSDATGWMGMFCLNLMRIALELAKENRVYEALATKFFQHYVYVAAAMKHMGNRDYQLWDEQDGFFYDVLRYPDGRFHKFRVRSLVGLIPLFAVERLEETWIEPFKEFTRELQLVPDEPPRHGRSSVDPPDRSADGEHDLRADDRRPASSCAACSSGCCDPDEFLSRLRHPQPVEVPRASTRSRCDGREVGYEPAESIEQDQGRQLELARADLVPDDVPADRVAAQARHGVRRRRSPVRRPAATAADLRSRRWRARSPRRMIRIFTRDERRAAAGLRRRDEVPGRPALARSPALLRVLPRRQRRRPRGVPPDGWTALVASLIDEWR